MKKIFVKTSMLLVVLTVAISCSKNATTGPAGATGPTGPNLSGNLQGVVSLYDVSGAKQQSTTILAGDSLVLTNNSSGAVLKTATSTTGSYTFTNISTGTYSMTISRAGYGTVLSKGIQFTGGGNADRNFALSVVPTTSVSSATAVDTTIAGAGGVSENYIKVRGYVPVSSSETTVMVFVSVSYLSFVNSTPGNFSATYTATVAPGVTSYKINIPTANLYDLGFMSNDP
ncbi:MAG TPA: carboxypeptidase-like regulatory domain-containing protein, partial [Bacteroidia bacterium]|nr:carboxypeptidase-like regulatory domain-containing protein [Bacteroidia bacterium]